MRIFYSSPRATYTPQRGDAHKAIRCFDYLRPGSRLVVVARKSRRDKAHRLQGQLDHLCGVAERAGHIVLGRVTHQDSGWDASWIAEAAVLAKQLRADAILAESTNRLIRHPCYHSEDYPHLQANEENLRRLLYFADGVPLVTLLHPMEPPEAERLYETIRGRRMSGRTGGGDRMPGYKKRRRERLLPDVLQLIQQGHSIRQTAKQLGVAVTTLRDWLRGR